MSLAKTLLRPVAYLAGRHAARQTKTFLQAHQRTAQVQQQLLRSLLAAHAETQFGRDHGFAKIADYRDFRTAVPIGSYESLEPYIQRVLDGHSDALLPAGEQAMMFSMAAVGLINSTAERAMTYYTAIKGQTF